MNYILAFLGIMLSFGIKYFNRKDKKALDIKYWWKDNMEEFILSFIIVAISMIMLSYAILNEDALKAKIDDKFPDLAFITLPGRMVVSLFIGYISNQVVYWLAKRKKNG